MYLSAPALFLSTPSARRATRSRGSSRASQTHFYPRPPRGGRPGSAPAWTASLANFYPRPPRGGRHDRHGAPTRPLQISIHALREEGDIAVLPSKNRVEYFYPRPPRGGRRRPRGHEAAPNQISIHTLREEGDPLPCCRGVMLPDFYPRPPRGGRRARWNPLVLIPVFLSTPSARRATAIDVSGQIGRQISIHALREEGDLMMLCSSVSAILFLSPPAARWATRAEKAAEAAREISTHPLREEGDRRASAWPRS